MLAGVVVCAVMAVACGRGDGPSAGDSDVLAPVPGLEKVTAIAAGANHN